jgi:hypothetical protein
MNVILFLSEMTIFKVNLKAALGVGFPVFFSFSVVHYVFSHDHGITICETSKKEMFLSYLGLSVLYMPILCATYLSQLSEMRLFFLGENTTRNQDNMLELFEKQYEGVILLTHSPQSNVEELVYMNEAF